MKEHGGRVNDCCKRLKPNILKAGSDSGDEISWRKQITVKESYILGNGNSEWQMFFWPWAYFLCEETFGYVLFFVLIFDKVKLAVPKWKCVLLLLLFLQGNYNINFTSERVPLEQWGVCVTTCIKSFKLNIIF